MKSTSRFGWLLLFGWSALLSLAVFWPVLRLPFFFDDLDHIPFAVENSYRTLLVSAGNFPYFRPIGVISLKLVADLFGRYNTVAQHAAGLLLHVLNGWLAGLLATYWVADQQKLTAGLLSATLFLLFPFSYQVVPWVDARYHPLVLLFVLVSLIAAHKVWRGAGRGWLWLGLAAAGLAPLVHENGLVLAPLVVLLAFIEGNWRSHWRSLLGWQLMTAVGLGLALWGAPSSDELRVVSAETIYQNATYFVQGVSYPIGWFGGSLVRAGFNDFQVVWITVAFAMLLLFYLAWRQQMLRHLFFALAWVAAASMLSITLLEFGYVIDGPRLLYVGSVGVAWAWGMVIASTLNAENKPVIRIAIVLLATFIFIQSVNYMQGQVRLHTLLGEAYSAIIDGAKSAEAAGTNTIFVNTPDWLSERQQTFAVGHEGVMFRPDYIEPTRVIEVAFKPKMRHQFVRYDATMPDLPYVFGVGGVAWAEGEQIPSRVFQTTYDESSDAINVASVGAVAISRSEFEQPIIFTPNSTPSSGQIRLGLPQIDVTDQQTLHISLPWQVVQPVAATTVVFVHLLDDGGHLVGQADGQPLGGIYHFTNFDLGEVVLDQRQLPISDGVELRVGLYDAATGERWVVMGEGVISAENALSIPINR